MLPSRVKVVVHFFSLFLFLFFFSSSQLFIQHFTRIYYSPSLSSKQPSYFLIYISFGVVWRLWTYVPLNKKIQFYSTLFCVRMYLFHFVKTRPRCYLFLYSALPTSKARHKTMIEFFAAILLREKPKWVQIVENRDHDNVIVITRRWWWIRKTSLFRRKVFNSWNSTIH